jgi:ribosomal protein S18 acetylase RimI-like enzyme
MAEGSNAAGIKRLEKLTVALGTLTEKNVKLVKLLNEVAFPVSYNDNVYEEILLYPDYGRLAYYNDVMVGAICCRVEKAGTNGHANKRLYIMTLGVLEKYRRHGVATQLMEYVLNKLESETDIEAVYLNVQTSNAAAIKFYEKFGFKNVKLAENYYRANIEPPHAYVLFRPRDLAAEDVKYE